MTIEEFVKKNKTFNPINPGSVKKAQQLIESNEEVLYAINTNVLIVDNKECIMNNGTKGMFSLNNGISGIIAVTSKRILFCSSIIGNVNIKQINIDDIKSIEENINGLTKMGQIRIKGTSETLVINIYKKGIAEELKESISKAQSYFSNSKAKSITNEAISTADEILKFKNLLDQGIMTQEEFEKKKKELLG